MKTLKLSDIKELGSKECNQKLHELARAYASWKIQTSNDPKATMMGVHIRKNIAQIKTKLSQLANKK